jgi:hypothetical protein
MRDDQDELERRLDRADRRWIIVLCIGIVVVLAALVLVRSDRLPPENTTIIPKSSPVR